MLFLIAYLGQYLVSFSGESSILFYTSETGHAEFVVTASRDFSIEDVFRRYEVLVAQPHQRFSPSKPPGQLLLYMLFDRMAPSLDPIQIPESFVDMRHFQIGALFDIYPSITSSLNDDSDLSFGERVQSVQTLASFFIVCHFGSFYIGSHAL